MNNWNVLKQDFVGNVGIELLELEDDKEGTRRFVSLTKYEKTKNVIIPIENIDEIIDKIKSMVEEE